MTDPTPTRVELVRNGLQVVVEAVGGLDDVAGRALALWDSIGGNQPAPGPDTPTAGTGISPIAENQWGAGFMPPELQLPARLAPEPDDDDRRGRRPAHPA